MNKSIANFIVNNREYELLVEPRMTLVEVLRDQLGLTGTKFNCGVGECGACTVLVNGMPRLSCSTLALAVRDSRILTIEGLSDGTKLHPIQRSFVEHGAIQCGYCTPGMILTTKALLDNNPNPTKEEVRKWMAGNLCRCTGYTKIIDAVMEAAKALKGEAGTL